MSLSINQIVLVGNLGKNPRLDKTRKDTPVCNMSLATSQTWVDPKGDKQEKTDWHSLVLYGTRATAAAEQLKKGDRVTVIGRLENNEYTTRGPDGIETRHKISQIVVQKIIWDNYTSDVDFVDESSDI
jgi:single-strand DNA-binding protein